jgi:hypothetical protein
MLSIAAPAFAVDNPNLAPRAKITASQEAWPGAAAAVADGRVPAAGSRYDWYPQWEVYQQGRAWAVNADQLPASLIFTWPEPVTVSAVVYYGRTTWIFDVFKDYAVYLDDAETPVVQGAFRNGHGPQPVTLPTPTRTRKLRLEFRSRHGGSAPGAAEVQVFAMPPAQEDLLCRFTDLSLDYRYAYYPSHNLVRIHLPKPPADATDWRLTLRPEAGGAVLAERSGKLPTATGGEAMPVPDLPEGDYTLILTLTGGAKPIVEERGIRRDRPEWEGNKLGREDIVIPPFTPLTVDEKANRVGCVLRTHTHGAAGLWRQVVSRDRELLAGPVRLEVTQGGKVHTAGGPVPRFTGKKPTTVSGEAAWTAGALSGTTRFAYDYGGMQTITLELAPTETEIERAQLVIPLKASEAWLMHPVTTQLRQHFAGRIPAGKGKVWDSSKVPDRLNGNFVPYIYVGGPERGICFAADNDKDWITDGNVPMMVIERDGDSVLLRLNLIAKPSRLARPRTLTFALQATPAKPMPEQPYNWRRWWATGTVPDIKDVQIKFWGGNMYWGGRHFATSIYPAFKDYGFWEHLAESRRTGKRNPEYEKQWLARFKDVPEKDYKSLQSHFNAGLGWAAGTPAIAPDTKKFNYVIPYTNPRGAHVETPEFLTTYLDEWLQGDIVDPAWPGRNTFERPLRVHPGWPGIACWYQVEPVPSRIDMLLFYHKKMLETFADGIYWDNWFLQPNYTPAEAGGPGYVDDDGRPRAGVNLMGFRELVKRTATMMHVMGKRPLTYLHMTNVNIVPMLSFGTVNLDWEWRDQGHLKEMDMQERIRLDEILAHNLGLQSGNVPVAITGSHLSGLSGRDWLTRTLMAVCFPHEMRIHAGIQPVGFIQSQLTRFGYGLPDCKVFRYWEDGFPLRTEGAEMRALVLARNGKAMIALGNFGPAGATGPAVQQGGPSLEEYDAGQRGLAKAPTTGGAPAAPRKKAESYTVRFRLDLKALGIAEAARAWDVELRADRVKAARPRSAGMPAQPAELKRLAPGLFELTMPHDDFALIVVEPFEATDDYEVPVNATLPAGPGEFLVELQPFDHRWNANIFGRNNPRPGTVYTLRARLESTDGRPGSVALFLTQPATQGSGLFAEPWCYNLKLDPPEARELVIAGVRVPAKNPQNSPLALRSYPTGTKNVRVAAVSPIRFVRPMLGISDQRPIVLDRVARGQTAVSPARRVFNAQTEAPVAQGQTFATVLYGVANVVTPTPGHPDMQEIDQVGIVLTGPHADQFALVGDHRADNGGLKLLGRNGPGLRGGAAPESVNFSVRFNGVAEPGLYKATVRIVTQAGNLGVCSAGNPGEPLRNLFYLDIPVQATVE